MQRISLITLTLCLAAALVACDSGDTNNASSAPAAPPAWLLTTAPTDVVDVAAARDAAAGDTITLRGRVGGRRDPITAASGLFVIMDPAVPSCSDNPGDACKTPWDYCCETQETIKTNAATVQVVGADGAAVNLGDGAIKPLDTVIVTGTVASRDGGNMIVKATGVYKAPG